MTGMGLPDPARFAALLSGHSPYIAPSPAEALCACNSALSLWRVLPTFLPVLNEWIGPERDLAVEAALERLEAVGTAARVIAAMQLELTRRVVNTLDHHQIPYSLLKGAAARVDLYGEGPHNRAGLDIDIAVEAKHIDAAATAVESLGFVPAGLSSNDDRHYVTIDRVQQERVRRNHYELATLARRQVMRGLSKATAQKIKAAHDIVFFWHELDENELACYVTVDLHHGLGIDMPVETLVAQSRERTLGDRTFRVPSRAWMLFHLIFKLYWEGVHNYGKGAYQYADIARLVPNLDDSDAVSLAELLDDYQLQAGACYVLRRMEPAFGVSLPPPIAALVDELEASPRALSPIEANDLGDMWEKIWKQR